MKATALVIALTALAGCSVPQESVGKNDDLLNSCTADADCGDTGACKKVGDEKICVARKVALSGLQIVATPPGGLAEVGTSPAVFAASEHLDLGRSAPNGYVEKLDLAFPALQPVSFDITFPCDGETATEVPATIVLTSDRLAHQAILSGLPLATYVSAPATMGSTRQIATIPAGIYLGWVVPGETAACPTAPAPTVREFCFLDPELCAKNDAETRVKTTRIGATTRLNLPNDFALGGTITSGFSLDKWTLDIIDFDGARRISEARELKQPAGVATLITFDSLHFTWEDRVAEPLIRLTPPAGSSAPTIYWDLATSLGPSSKYEVKLTVGAFQNHSVTTQVLVSAGKEAVIDGKKTIVEAYQPGVSVSFVPVSIDGLDCIYTLGASALTNEEGYATVDLPPGRYQVIATPPSSSNYAVSSMPSGLTVRDQKDTSGGHLLELKPRASLDGQLASETGTPLAGVDVTASPSTQTTSFVLGNDKDVKSLPGNTSATTTADDGAFQLPLDVNALLDVSAKPAAASGFPWTVVPQFQVSSSASTRKKVTSTWPAVIHGVLTSASGARIANASVSAYVPVPLADGKGDIAVQVGAATTDANGNYVLLLPASIGAE